MIGDNPQLTTYRGPVPFTRATQEELQAQVRMVANSAIVRALLEALDGGLLVLNEHRQIVAADLRRFLALPEEAGLRAIGLRPGEALGCVHVRERPGGCGASEACRTCGALKAILSCQLARETSAGECLVTASNGALLPLELSLRASPVVIEGQTFTVLAIRDASDEKRRGVLEQVFLHDLLNLLAPLSIYSQQLGSVPEDRFRETGQRVAGLVQRLASEVHAQRALLQAERGSLELVSTSLRVPQVLGELAAAVDAHPSARERELVVEEAPDLELQTDKALLLRVLTNMVVNALEATPEKGRVRLWCEAAADAGWRCVFHVHNDSVMAREVAVNVFQRSFSTKALKGRGLGTYSMKLLGERYLGGEVSFVSREGEGTTFMLRLRARPLGQVP